MRFVPGSPVAAFGGCHHHAALARAPRRAALVVAIRLMRTLLLLALATQGLSLQLPARPRLRKPQARPASEAYQLPSYRAFGVLAATVIAFSTENAEALTATPSPGADALQTAQWRALEKDKAEAAKAKMYEERGAADATRAREREARRAAMEARRLEAKREASAVAAARTLEEATVVQARTAAMQEAAAAAQERATAAKARAIAARSMSAEELVSASAAEKVMSTDELAAAAALQAEQAAVDAEVAASVKRAEAVVARSREERAERQARFEKEDRETQQRVRAVTAPVALLAAGVYGYVGWNQNASASAELAAKVRGSLETQAGALSTALQRSKSTASTAASAKPRPGLCCSCGSTALTSPCSRATPIFMTCAANGVRASAALGDADASVSAPSSHPPLLLSGENRLISDTNSSATRPRGWLEQPRISSTRKS